MIRALKEYTMSSNVILQQQVLSLLAQLIKLRVNYSLLDADQVSRVQLLTATTKTTTIITITRKTWKWRMIIKFWISLKSWFFQASSQFQLFKLENLLWCYITLRFYLQPQFRYELLHTYYILHINKILTTFIKTNIKIVGWRTGMGNYRDKCS